MRIRGHDAVVFARKPIFGGIYQLPEGILLRARGGNFLSVLFAFLLIALFFHVLATVAECFFCPALAKISVYLKLRDDVADADVVGAWERRPWIFSRRLRLLMI